MTKNLTIFAIIFFIMAVAQVASNLVFSRDDPEKARSDWVSYLVYQCQNKQAQVDAAEDRLAFLHSLYRVDLQEINRNILIGEIRAKIGGDAWALISKEEQERLILEWPSKPDAKNSRREKFVVRYSRKIEEADKQVTAKKLEIKLWHGLSAEKQMETCELEAKSKYDKMSVYERLGAIPNDDQYKDFRAKKMEDFRRFLADLEPAQN